MRPDVRAFVEMLEANPFPTFTADVIAQMRQLPPDMAGELDLPVGELAVQHDVAAPGPAGPIALRLFDARAERSPGPVIMFVHGGGFVAGSIASHASLAATFARALDLPVISVEYRLAPENRWPAAPDDVEAAARWIAQNGAAFDREFTGLILCGDSAGGNLAIVTALALRDEPADLPVILQIPIYPLTDASRMTDSRRNLSDGNGMSSENLRLYEEHMQADASHWRYSPLLADVSGLPPAVVVTATYDPLRDEGRAYAAKLVQAGVPTNFYEAEGNIHGFATFRSVIESANDDLERVFALARSMISDL